MRRWRVYRKDDSYWKDWWIAWPPDAVDFDDSYVFATHRAALKFAMDASHGNKIYAEANNRDELWIAIDYVRENDRHH